LVVPRFNMPAESTARVPDVAVCMVKLPEVFVQEEVPPEAMTKAPVELPRLVAAVPVALMLVVPVTVNPPVPWIKPVPELTPTEVTAPAVETVKLVKPIKLVPAVVPDSIVSQPVPMVRAALVMPAESVTFPMFTPFGLHVEPPVHAVNVGAMETPLMVLVPDSPVVTLTVGETSSPLVVLVFVVVVASVKAREATVPVSLAV